MKKPLFIFGLVLFILGVLFFLFNTSFKYIFQSNAYLKSSKVAKAIELLEEGSKKYPTNNKIKFLLSRAYLLSGETELANKTILSKETIEALKQYSDFQDFLVELSEANYHLGNGKHAAYFANQYLSVNKKFKLSKKTVKNLLVAGQVLPDKSVELWETAYNIAHALKRPELKESLKALLLPKYLQIVENLKSEKNYDEALSVLNKAKVLGKSAEVNYELAKIYTELGKAEQFQKCYEEAIQLEPENDEYKIAYANALKKAALSIKDKIKRDEYFEKIKLLLANEDDPRKISILKKIINLNAKYKITHTNLKLTMIGDYLYPSLLFQIEPVSDVSLKNYKVIFLDENQAQLDIYEAPIAAEELKHPIEVISRNPIEKSNLVDAKLFVNNEFVKEYKIQHN